MGPVGIEPTPLVLQTSVRTSYTKDPILIMLEYPSRSNLNCLIVVLRGLGRKGDEFLNLSWIVDIREIEKTIIIVGSSGLEPLPWGPDLQSGCRIRTTFATQFVPRSGIEPLPFACKTNTLPLRQQGKLYRVMVLSHSRVRYEPSLVPDHSAFWWT